MTAENKAKLLVWLPSPLGDAVMSVAALKSLRQHFADREIYFLCSKTVREVLQPSSYADGWIDYTGSVAGTAVKLRQIRFDEAVLLKNSFGSAAACFLAGIKRRIGYDRDCRGIFLTDKIRPEKDKSGKYKPMPMIDYYLNLCAYLGAAADDRSISLEIDDKSRESLFNKFCFLRNVSEPVVILVPAGAFGPSKYWQWQKYAAAAERLIETCQARIFICVSAATAERSVAEKIASAVKAQVYNLGEKPVTLAELKALIDISSLVIGNDTGPRHIAGALGKNVITIFGPNNPAWTQSGYENEIQLIGTAPCAPCDKPKCSQARHLCMESISVETVIEAAEKLLNK